MNTNVKRIGNEFEKKLCELFGSKGYWCHNFSYDVNGQPCDIIALKNNSSWLIDVKHCVGNTFSFSRIEANQKGCFKYASSVGVGRVGFAIWFETLQEFRWMSYDLYENFKKQNVKSVKSCCLVRLESLM